MILKSRDIASKQGTLDPIKGHQHAIASGDLLHQIDTSPQDEGDASSVAEDWHVTNSDLRQCFTAAHVCKQPEIQEFDYSRKKEMHRRRETDITHSIAWNNILRN